MISYQNYDSQINLIINVLFIFIILTYLEDVKQLGIFILDKTDILSKKIKKLRKKIKKNNKLLKSYSQLYNCNIF